MKGIEYTQELSTLARRVEQKIQEQEENEPNANLAKPGDFLEEFRSNSDHLRNVEADPVEITALIRWFYDRYERLIAQTPQGNRFTEEIDARLKALSTTWGLPEMDPDAIDMLIKRAQLQRQTEERNLGATRNQKGGVKMTIKGKFN